jgi:hypothetical protein
MFFFVERKSFEKQFVVGVYRCRKPRAEPCTCRSRTLFLCLPKYPWIGYYFSIGCTTPTKFKFN